MREDPRVFMDQLWRQVYDAAPDDLQPYVWARLADFAAQLGALDDPATSRRPLRAPPEVHARR